MGGALIRLQLPGQLSENLHYIAVTLVPLPWVHFFMIGFALLTSRGSERFQCQYDVVSDTSFFDWS